MTPLDTFLSYFGIRRKAPEQVGASTAPGAAEPLAHLSTQPPPAMAELEWTGDDYDTVATRPVPPRAARTWRQAAGGDPVTNPVPLSDGLHATAEGPHLTAGEPDTRRGHMDQAAGPRPELSPMPEHPRNVRQDVALHPEAAPVRPRQGFTGEDPTRAARQQVAFTIRPFDKGIADHPGAITKGGQPNPLAARPPERKRLVGGRPTAAGSEGTGMQPVGPQANTVRTVPTGWDTNLVNPGAEAVTAAGRANGWRAK